MKVTHVLLFLSLFIIACNPVPEKRIPVSLNGVWQLATSETIDEIPGSFDATIPVPGLVDLALPSPDTVSTSDMIYWYSREFTTDDRSFEICRLKINKAKYHTRVFLNDRLVGENPYSFTPTELDLTPYLNAPGKSNHLLVAVGCRNMLPPNVSDGHDFEKDYYYPGIYDDVHLIYSSAPYIQQVQCIPEIEEEQLRVQAKLWIGQEKEEYPLNYAVFELQGGRKVASGHTTVTGSETDFRIKIPACRFWSPEDPFLYRLELETPGDNYSTRFGMRSFSFDPETKLAMLNGKPYFLRGTNICIYRFFDDPSRTDQPWQTDWPVSLHEKFKTMHWNSIRYCIGFPPERWYEVADSLGFLIADEFPLWYGNNPVTIDSLDREITADDLAGEYKDWMQERWNHPCVVIWDAQNESVTDITGDAMKLVRGLDLSNRPWDNGWAAPRSDTDPIESHPYLYTHFLSAQDEPRPGQLLSYFFDTVRIPNNDPNERDPAPGGGIYENPVLINEYCWLWMNRDGSPTRLTKPVYDNAFGKGLSSEQMYTIYARHLALMTEYWRAHRKAAGVLHFCGLGYSRPDEPRGETSDNFTDIDNLVFEPHFLKYVRPAFSPVGLMLDVWDQSLEADRGYQADIYLVNDLGVSWSNPVEVFFESDEQKTEALILKASADAYERVILPLQFKTPSQPGSYDLVAEIVYKGEKVRSVREINILRGSGSPAH